MTPWDQIIAGQLIEGIIAGYTSVMGVEWFYALVAFLAFGLIYLRTQNMGVVGVTALLTAGLLFNLLPTDVQRIAYFFLALGIGAIIYKVFKS